MKRSQLFVLALMISSAPSAVAQQRSYNLLTTGNGFGFQIFDFSQNKISTFLEHPYRYLRPSPSDPHAEGVVRRNLVYDFYFGVRNATDKGWLNASAAPVMTTTPEYVDQAHIIHAPATAGSITADSYFFAPFDYSGNAMVALLKTANATDVYALFNFHMGTASNPDTPGSDGESVHAAASGHAVVETGPGGGFMVYVPLSTADHEDCANVFANIGTNLGDNVSCAGSDVVPGFQRHLVAGDNGWMGVAMQFVDSSNPADADAAAAALVAWANGRAPDKILADARAEFEAWRKPPAAAVSLCSDAEKAIWRQSEAVLRMAQIREVNTATSKNNGMILASLPGGGGGSGNWHTGWVRDATYATVALARMGHAAEAKAALGFFLNAGPVGGYASYVNNVNYRISLTRYFGNGQEECDWNANGPNTETDGWGLFLWAARQYVEASGDSAWLTSSTANGVAYDVMQAQIAAALESNLETSSIMRADSSVWESHQPGKHYLFTTMAATRGLCDMAALAKKANKAADQTHYAQLAGKIRTAFMSAYLNPQMALGGSIEGLQGGHYYDGSAAEVFNWSLIPDIGGTVATATFNVLNQLRVQSGGFKRNDDGASDYDNNEWILVDLRMSDALRRAGKTSDADSFLGQVVQKATVNFNLLPELYNDTAADGQIGVYFGSIPMVGYGAGAFVMAILDRSGVGEPNDCGDGNSRGLQAWSCSGATGGSGGTGGGGSGGTGGGGSGGSGGGGSGGSGGGGAGGLGGGGSMGDGGAGSGVPYRAACLCDLGGAGATGGTLLLLLVPWLFVATRLARRSRRS